jgi:anhydro-N-acetylmuramic acid kinase
MRVIGLISGTSTDGIDAALVEISGAGAQLKLLRFEVYPYPRGLRRRLLSLAANGALQEACHLNFYIGELFAEAAARITRAAGFDLAQIDLIGSHGQTLCHLPTQRREGRYRLRSTLQLGEPSVIAERTGVTTVADFRPRDIAAGGEGAPLTPYFHRMLFAHPERSRLVINIGGISNMTHLPRAGGPETVLAFDSGPGNMLIDGVVERLSRGRQTMDRDGRLARRGRVSARLLAELRRHPFLRRPPPKTTGREAFGSLLIARVLQAAKRLRLTPADLVASVTAFTVDTLVQHYRDFIVPRGGADEVIVGGGGVRNPAVMTPLAAALAPVPVAPFENYGLDSKAIEAMAFAAMAAAAIRGETNTLPAATGARRPVVMGKIVPGRNAPPTK